MMMMDVFPQLSVSRTCHPPIFLFFPFPLPPLPLLPFSHSPFPSSTHSITQSLNRSITPPSYVLKNDLSPTPSPPSPQCHDTCLTSPHLISAMSQTVRTRHVRLTSIHICLHTHFHLPTYTTTRPVRFGKRTKTFKKRESLGVDQEEGCIPPL